MVRNTLARARSGTVSSLQPALQAVIMVWFFSMAGNSMAFSELNEAQSLVFDTPHLENTKAGQVLQYKFSHQQANEEPLTDLVSLQIKKDYEDERRDVSLDFLTKERRIPFPDFNGYRGNPVIIAMLEHIARNLAEQAGGGTLYFRNRIRDGLAKDVDIVKEKITLSDKDVEATILKFKPFVGDAYIGPQPEHANAEFIITLSSEISGGVLAVAVDSTHDKNFYYRQEISLKQ